MESGPGDWQTTRYQKAPDFAGTAFVAGWDFVNNDNYANDDEGHGAHVAGTIAQTTNNNLGVAGIAFKTTIMPVKVLNAGGSGTYDMDSRWHLLCRG
jgi:serine protease